MFFNEKDYEKIIRSIVSTQKITYNMKRHFNKKWLLEKEYLLLKVEDNAIPWSRLRTTREAEIESRITHKFYYRQYGKNSPKSWRKLRNRSQKAKSKQNLIKILKGYDTEFNDNYKDANWWYW